VNYCSFGRIIPRVSGGHFRIQGILVATELEDLAGEYSLASLPPLSHVLRTYIR
jgi:hypothetical protein